VGYLPGAHQFPGVPALAGGISAGGAAYCPASLVRLKPGLRSDGGRASRLQPVACQRTSGSPGFSRWDTCRDGAYCPASPIRLQPGLRSDGGRTSRRSPVACQRTSGSPGFSRWNVCRGRTNFRESRLQPVGYLPGAQPTARQAWSGCSRDSGRTAGARRSGVPAVAGGMPKNIRESRLQPVEYLPGAQPTARQAWSG
jgi:hypothetical protein